jgi:cyanophycin synthetase
VITNVAEDHLGLDGIDTLAKLAKVKSVVAESVCPSGYAVLNADDDLVYAMKDQLRSKVALFSIYSDNSRIEEHCSRGGLAAVYENGYLLLRIGNHIIPIEEAVNVPITFGGKAEFNIANVLAACLAAYTNRIKLSTIRKALRSFIPSPETTPGRINIYDFQDFQVIVDYAHNPHGVKALGKFIKTFDASVKVGVITGVGDRRDEDIIALGEEAAKVFDEIIIRHDDDLRGRTPEEMDRLLTTGVHRVDRNKPISYYWCECDAVIRAMQNVKPQSLIVVLIDNIKKVTECILQYQHEREETLEKAV